MAGRKQRAMGKHRANHKIQYNMANNVDRIAALQEFENAFGPAVRKALLDGKTDKQIMEQFKPIVGARLVTIATTGEDSVALAAGREILNRLEGTPIQKTENSHRFQRLPDAELDAIIESEVESLQKLEKVIKNGKKD